MLPIGDGSLLAERFSILNFWFNYFNPLAYLRTNSANCSVLFQKSMQLPCEEKNIYTLSTVLEMHHHKHYLWKCFMRNENNLVFRNRRKFKNVSTFPNYKKLTRKETQTATQTYLYLKIKGSAHRFVKLSLNYMKTCIDVFLF